MSAPPKYTDEPPAAPHNGSGSGSGKAQKTYGSVPTSGSSEPLLAPGSSSGPGGAPPVPCASRPSANGSSHNNAWMDQPSEDDLPDDFKVGVAVIDCDASIRLGFIRKVYTILAIQLACTAAVGLGMNTNAAVQYTHENPWIIWVPMIGSFVSLIGTYVKRHDFPVNMILLGLFTLFEAVMVGALTSFYESRIVLQAVLITLGVFLGLTLFTFQTRLDFSSFYPFLFAGIWGIIAASLVQLFLPFSATVDLVIAGFSVVLFSAFILYDTQMIMKRLSVDEVILGVLSLYLDILNLFLSILRVLNNQNRN